MLWFIAEDGSRRRLTTSFLSAFYVGGERAALDKVRAYLEQGDFAAHAFITERKELYEGPRTVLAVQTGNPVFQQRLTWHLKRQFADLKLSYYDTSIPLSVRFAVLYGAFPLARCFVSHDDKGNLLGILPQDDPWQMDYRLPDWRIMTVVPDVSPQFAAPRSIEVSLGEEKRVIALDAPRKALLEFSECLKRYDPDILLAYGGDGWLFPTLLGWAKEFHVAFNPSRERNHPYNVRDALTFQSYGVVHYRAQQTYLFGRAHLDPGNVTTGGFSLEAAAELSRVTALPLQVAARNSPGAGFTAMQIAEALRRGVLVPEHKYQTERPKSIADLNLADNGGLNYRPVVGLHEHVAALDYFSMYASTMAKMNISGETVGARGKENLLVPETGVPINQDSPGLVAAVLRPLIAKRLKVKRLMAELGEQDPRHAPLHAISDALKWLGYVSFGYQGFKHNLYGNIQAHEAITAFGREMLVRAIETAQEQGFTVLEANTDSLFIKQAGYFRKKHFQPLIEAINQRTGMVIMMEALFDWIVFLPSKGNPQIGATNRYFGRLEGGGSKVRGLSQRRYDTPAWVVSGEKEVISLLVSEVDAKKLEALLPQAIDMLRAQLERLNRGQVPAADLVITRRLSREPEAFKGVSPSASIARQLMENEREVRVGQKLEFIYIHNGKSGVVPVDHVHWPEDGSIDKQEYRKLLLRAIFQLLSPLGVHESDMPALAGEGVMQLPMFAAGYAASKNPPGPLRLSN